MLIEMEDFTTVMQVSESKFIFLVYLVCVYTKPCILDSYICERITVALY